jgi:hypothetical protein
MGTERRSLVGNRVLSICKILNRNHGPRTSYTQILKVFPVITENWLEYMVWKSEYRIKVVMKVKRN